MHSEPASQRSEDRPDPDHPRYTLLIPVFDEEENIPELLAEVEGKLGQGPAFELLFVDDGSQDGTVPAIRAAARNQPRIRLVRHRGNRGKSAALVTGAQAARAAWIATMDGDGQNDPADLGRLVSRALEPGNPASLLMVAGRRRRRNDTRLKQISSRLANGVRMRLTGDPTPDAACGMKVFRREAFLELPRFDNMHRFLSSLFRRAGGEVVSVDVEDRPRAHGQSKYGLHNRLWVGISDLFGVMWLDRRALAPAELLDDAAPPAPAEPTPGQSAEQGSATDGAADEG